ncbi:uncharacterized protein LOC109946642 [Prunus persica]|uniref:uncharacterized protein LOC109946642 n=1 Tax=Prunus persica TaxID=3760 RepID=UPI0009AB4B44|nr:uncharacterized protein LOC109946642 [Prunus persica]
MMTSSATMSILGHRINGLVGNTEAANKSYCPQSLVLGTNFSVRMYAFASKKMLKGTSWDMKENKGLRLVRAYGHRPLTSLLFSPVTAILTRFNFQNFNSAIYLFSTGPPILMKPTVL